MQKLSLNARFSIKLIMSLKFKFLIIPFLLFFSVSSCSRTKGYFSNYASRNIEVDKQEPQLLASRSNILPIQSSLVSSSQTLVIASANHDVLKIQSSSSNLNSIIDKK